MLMCEFNTFDYNLSTVKIEVTKLAMKYSLLMIRSCCIDWL